MNEAEGVLIHVNGGPSVSGYANGRKNFAHLKTQSG
jgi:hypothetical protein